MSSLSSNSAQHSCRHRILTATSSEHALSTGHRAYSHQQILTAMTGKRKHSPDAADEHRLDEFPEPLILPGDAMDLEPRYPPQSFQSWLKLGEKNQVTARRNVIYVAAPPQVESSVKFMKKWSTPMTESRTHQHFMREIDFQGVILYLRVFYHGMEVKLLPIDLAFTSWEDSPRPKVKSKSKTKTKAGKERAFGAVALSTGTEAIRIRFRSTPPPNSDSQKDVFPYSHQLDLNDMVDVALGVLPPDAYALLLLTDHDMYESEDDDFCCGRAWGASRVAVVSGARYQPSLDSLHGVDEAHVWPASHCRDYVDSMSNVHSDREMGGRQHGNKKRMVADGPQPAGQNGISALARAIEAHWTTFVPGSHWNGPPNFFLRICRTASHELGHCFGLDHCMYKACMMQGTASVAEDIRQPPYLCPVCEAKIAWALADEYPLISNSGSKGSTHREIRGETAAPSGGSRSQTALQRWKQDRHAALKHFCEFHSSSFSPLLAWSNAFLEPTQDLGSENEKLDL